MPLRSTLSTPEGKRRYVRRLFATIADRYDFITGFLSYGQDRRWKRRLIQFANLQSSDRVLDLACGTGDIVFAAAPRVARDVGLDVTHRMLQLAQRRSLPPKGGSHEGDGSVASAHPVASAFRRKASFVTGDMLALPFPDRSFTVITIGYGLRNVPDLPQSLREIGRVLAPGGTYLAVEHATPWGWRAFSREARAMHAWGRPRGVELKPLRLRDWKTIAVAAGFAAGCVAPIPGRRARVRRGWTR